MRPHEEPGIIRSNSHDTKWWFALTAAARTMDLIREHLGDRLKIINGMDTAGRLYDESEQLVADLLSTYPPEKHEAMLRQLQHVYFHIDVGRPVLKETANTIIDVDQLGTLIDFAHANSCRLCSHPTWCGSRCELGKVFDRILPETRGKKESWLDIDVTKDD